MPNVILTDEELQEVDRLLAEFDPERYPDTAALLKILSDDTRETLCTWVRESQRTALDLAVPMRAVVGGAESAGLKPAIDHQCVSAADEMVDGWDVLLDTAWESHPLHDKAREVLEKLDHVDALLHFQTCVIVPAQRFSRLERFYESPAEATA